MRLPLVQQHSPIGLDAGAHSLKAVQLVRARGGWAVASAVALPRLTGGGEPDDAELRRLTAVLDRHGFVGRDVVLAVPPAALLSGVLELPAKSPGLPLERLALAEFARLNKADAAALTFSSWELPPSARASRATYLLAVGAKTATLDAHVDRMESAGLHVVAADDPYSAVARGCLHGRDGRREMTAVIDLGWTAVTLAVLHGGTLVYTRKLAGGGLAQLIQSLRAADVGAADDAEGEARRVGFGDPAAADADDADVRDAVAANYAPALKEIGLAFGYATHQYPDANLARVLLTGGGAMLPGAARRFGETLGIETSAAAVAEAVSPTLMTALGLALWTEAAR